MACFRSNFTVSETVHKTCIPLLFGIRLKKWSATKFIYWNQHIYYCIFSLNNQKGKKLTESRVAVRTRAKSGNWRKLGSGAKGAQMGNCSFLVSISPEACQVSPFFVILFMFDLWIKLLKWCTRDYSWLLSCLRGVCHVGNYSSFLLLWYWRPAHNEATDTSSGHTH